MRRRSRCPPRGRRCWFARGHRTPGLPGALRGPPPGGGDRLGVSVSRPVSRSFHPTATGPVSPLSVAALDSNTVRRRVTEGHIRVGAARCRRGSPRAGAESPQTDTGTPLFRTSRRFPRRRRPVTPVPGRPTEASPGCTLHDTPSARSGGRHPTVERAARGSARRRKPAGPRPGAGTSATELLTPARRRLLEHRVRARARSSRRPIPACSGRRCPLRASRGRGAPVSRVRATATSLGVSTLGGEVRDLRPGARRSGRGGGGQHNECEGEDRSRAGDQGHVATLSRDSSIAPLVEVGMFPHGWETG